MKRGVASAIVLWSLLPAHSIAQRVAIHAGSGPPTSQFANFGNFGLPPLAPIPPLGLTTPGFSSLGRFGSKFRQSGFGFGGFGYGFPGFYDGYGGYYGEGYPSAPNVIVLMPQQQSPPPPEPARPEIREYRQPAAQQPSAEFSIVSNDGSVRSAVAAWVQGGMVHYVAPDGTGGELPLGSVDREATRRANAQKQLTLQLPAPSAPAQRR